ncbi:MAG: TonB-dependent receptor [Flavobacteriales bacterium]|nr:MAG: TonB-dependent receptor [Flavobacteriales bacterium]
MHVKYRITTLLFFSYCMAVFAQVKITGIVTDTNGKPLNGVEVFQSSGGSLTKTNTQGIFSFVSSKKQLQLIFYLEEYKIKEVVLNTAKNQQLNIKLNPIVEQLNEVVLTQRKRKIFALRSLKKVEGTAIYAGKKSEVVLLNEMIGNKATNNARQIYSQVVGLNIYENDDAGLQLNIGGRGLDPNRTSNFNTRQNGYDISADVLGYPESYYTPPADALKEIQVIRGAASLQYGTQFGGLLNFKFNQPPKNKKFELLTRQSLGSYGLFNSFNSLGGTVDKTAYYAYANYKKGDGFRPNSAFNAINIYAHVSHQITPKTTITLEATFLDYLAKQAGGLTDEMFYENPQQSNRNRNWFKVNWNLWAVKFKHDFSEKTAATLNLFGLNASRKALGYRTVPINAVDEIENGTYIKNRDLIVGNYKNWGAEARFLSNYNLLNTSHTFLVGAKFYNAHNSERQGAASKKTDADFTFIDKEDYEALSDFKFPNVNTAFFVENIFNISDKLTITPGARFEYIKTQSEGSYRKVLTDGAGNPLPGGILDYRDDRVKERSFVLLGVGFAYKPTNSLEMYANISQNYRSVTFNDIRTVSPTFVVDENIDDEKGGTLDFGIRGKYKNYVSYDISAFGLFYNDRIGVILASEGANKGDRLRTNVGDAFIFGVESLIDWNVIPTFFKNDVKDYKMTLFSNIAITQSEYTKSKEKATKGNQVEFIPTLNVKSGLTLGYKNLLANVQYTYLTKQYTDATNAEIPNKGDLRFGTIGPIPGYAILDVSFSYTYKNWQLEAGLNNTLNKKYFTRRATGYPGPGIIPSSPRNWYTTLQFRF